MCERFIEKFTDKVISEIEKEAHYIFLYIDLEYTWRKLYTPTIYGDFKCLKKDLISNLASNIRNISNYDTNYIDIISHLLKATKQEIIAINLAEGSYPEDNEKLKEEFEKDNKDIKLLEYIEENIGLVDCLDKVNCGCGYICLIEDKSGVWDKLVRNGLPVDE